MLEPATVKPRCHLIELPNEIRLQVISHLEDDQTTIFAFSATCKILRSLLVPQIFRSIPLRESTRSGGSIQALLRASYGQHVKELRYATKADDPGNGAGENESEEAEDILSSNSYDILGHLHRFPNLQRLTLTFEFDIANWDRAIFMFDQLETPDEVHRAESTLVWRKLLRQTFAALAANSPNISHHLKAFHLHKLPPVQVSVWETLPWQAFLSSFQELYLRVYGRDGGPGWHINTKQGICDFVPTLGGSFFDKVPCLTSLTLAGDFDCPFGLTGTSHDIETPLPLQPRHMPKLQSFTCNYTFIGRELVEFVTAHHATLEILRLYECYSAKPNSVLFGNTFSWAEFFTALRNAKPQLSVLRKLEIGETETLFDGKVRPIPFASENDEDTEEIRAVRKGLQEPCRRLFSYHCMDDEIGMAIEMVAENRAAFLKGEDQRAYDDLMKLIQDNISRQESQKGRNRALLCEETRLKDL
ncbi:MAG: hypothetical protein Q9160_003466 [Pyrenula sp. 1 TL-2023]